MSANQNQTGQDIVFGLPLPGRACGDCVACCKVLELNAPEMNFRKPAGVLCQHCTGASCGIYETRPQECRDWYCAWRRISAMPETTRPDKLGLMFDLVRPEQPTNILTRTYIAAHLTGTMEQLSDPLVDQAVNMFRQINLPIWLDHAGELTLLHPMREIAEILIDGKRPASPFLLNEANRWRQRCEQL